jgi:phospholipase/carboxylesterase
MARAARRLDPPHLGRLQARPTRGPRDDAQRGDRALGLGEKRDGIVFVPSSYDPSRPAPLMLCLHGAGGEARHRIDSIRPEAERDGVILVAPDSVGSTWDFLGGGYGPDVARIDRALAAVFHCLAVDPTRVAIEGFSDGASYALSLGLANGDLFQYIFAFSPGFMQPKTQVGAPHIYISHGMDDEVLPIRCSRAIVSTLRTAGYPLTYHEFDGGHHVPQEELRAAMDLLAGTPEPKHAAVGTLE